MIEGDTFRWRRMACGGCGALGPDVRIQTAGNGTSEQWEAAALEEATAEWNRRAPVDKPVDESVDKTGGDNDGQDW